MKKKSGPPRRSDADSDKAFWSFVNKNDGECWLWTGRLSKFGYGCYGLHWKENVLAHRYSYQKMVGPIPEGLFVLHRCDNPRCCNPEHLFVGTQADNMRDMAKKRRSTIGDRHPNARLTIQMVFEIKNRWIAGLESQVKLGKEFGVTQQHISQIVLSKRWSRALPK